MKERMKDRKNERKNEKRMKERKNARKKILKNEIDKTSYELSNNAIKSHLYDQNSRKPD